MREGCRLVLRSQQIAGNIARDGGEGAQREAAPCDRLAAENVTASEARAEEAGGGWRRLGGGAGGVGWRRAARPRQHGDNAEEENAR